MRLNLGVMVWELVIVSPRFNLMYAFSSSVFLYFWLTNIHRTKKVYVY